MHEVISPIVFLCRSRFALPLILVLLLTTADYSQQMATVTRPNASLHGTPVSTGKIMATLEVGTRVEILIAQGTWHLVQSQDYVGWISNGAIKADDSAPATTTSETSSPSRTVTLSQPAATGVPSSSPSSSRTYIRGSRGGCYYINSNGNKTYVDRSLCN